MKKENLEERLKLGSCHKILPLLRRGYKQSPFSQDGLEERSYLDSPQGQRYEAEDIGKGYLKITASYTKKVKK